MRPGTLPDGSRCLRITGGLTAVALLIGASRAEAQVGSSGGGRGAITVSATVLNVAPTGDARAALGAALLMGNQVRAESRLAQIRVLVAPGDPRRRIATINFLAN